jgi:hypothetical protein
MQMRWLTRIAPVGALAAAVLAGGCGESSSGPPTVDASAMATAVSSLNAAFSQNAVFQSLSALDGSGALAAVVVRAAMPLQVLPGASAVATAERSRLALSRLAALAPTAVAALFPANVLGKTFQWDTTSPAGYRITDSSATGAPSNGVRFLLYHVDTLTGAPSLPLTTTGYVDLADASTPQANVVHVLLKVNTLTAANYSVAEVVTTSSLSLTSTGYVANVVSGGPQINFDLSHALSLADSSLSTNYQAGGGGLNVSLVSTVSGVDSSLTMNWTASKNGTIQMVGSSRPSAVNLQFKFNNSTVATVGGTQAAPTITPGSGQTLTATDLIALGVIVGNFYQIYTNLSLVFVPGLLVFG